MKTAIAKEDGGAVLAPVAKIKSKTHVAIIAACCLASLAFAPATAKATEHVLINDYQDGGDSDSVSVDLNTYGVTTVTEIDLWGLGTAANQGGTPTYAYSDCEIENSSEVTIVGDSAYSEGDGDANAYSTVQAYSVAKNGSGHWIASYVIFGNASEQYNVDLGTGSLIFAVDGGNGGDPGGGTIYASVTY